MHVHMYIKLYTMYVCMVNHLCIFQEICIGIVANLVCHQSVASDLSNDQETV